MDHIGIEVKDNGIKFEERVNRLPRLEEYLQLLFWLCLRKCQEFQDTMYILISCLLKLHMNISIHEYFQLI